MKVSNVAQMRDLDQRAGSEYGIAEETLMENAAQAAYDVIRGELGVDGLRFAVFCGVGNNGGDGFAVARKLHSSGGDVTVFALGDTAKLKGAAKKNFAILEALPVDVVVLKDPTQAETALTISDVIVDALFGTGLAREVVGLYRNVIDMINNSVLPVVSLDIPSGINGDTGGVMGAVVWSDYTVAFGLPKLGNMLYPGYDHCGKLYVSHISFPPRLYNDESIKIALNELIPLPPRRSDAHKGACGKALTVAGSPSYMGAPRLAALSFLKAGGGLSYLAAPRTVAPFVSIGAPEVVLLPVEETAAGSLALADKDAIIDASRRVDIAIIGPGVSLDDETQQLVCELACGIDVPLLLDGDGITAVAADLSVVKGRKAPTILTPHSGEMARLVGKGVDEVDAERIAVLKNTCSDLGAYIVFKGSHSLVGCPDGSVYINTSGNPGMATAGSGDTLTGTIAAMLGLGLTLEEAVRVGVFMHGFAGDLAASEHGEDGMTAVDILNALPQAVRYYRRDFEELADSCYQTVYTL